MYNKTVMDQLIAEIKKHDGIADKTKLRQLITARFALEKKRTVFCCEDFAIRFCKADSGKFSNTVLALSVLLKYDDAPFVVCVVTPKQNIMLLANSSLLRKVSHSSKELRADNIKGSFNGVDILREVNGINNTPDNFEKLFKYHTGIAREDNIARLVAATNDIVARDLRFQVDDSNKAQLLDAVTRTQAFIASAEYKQLKSELDSRVEKVRAEIGIAVRDYANNVNLRGRVIEYLITEDDTPLKRRIINALRNKLPLPQFVTEDALGDFSKSYAAHDVEVDIKSKVTSFDSNPKGYNIDKLLSFLSSDRAVYMIYIVGIDANNTINTRLCSVFDERILKATNIVHHWAGRNSRGVVQFMGSGLTDILAASPCSSIDSTKATAFLKKLIERGGEDNDTIRQDDNEDAEG